MAEGTVSGGDEGTVLRGGGGGGEAETENDGKGTYGGLQ